MAIWCDFGWQKSMWRRAISPQGKAELLTCISRAPKWIAPYKRLALLYLGEEKVDSAGVIYEQALAIDPKDAEVHNNLGYIYSARGDFDKARRAYQTAMAESKDASTLRDAQGNLDIIESIQAGQDAGAAYSGEDGTRSSGNCE